MVGTAGSPGVQPTDPVGPEVRPYGRPWAGCTPSSVPAQGADIYRPAHRGTDMVPTGSCQGRHWAARFLHVPHCLGRLMSVPKRQYGDVPKERVRLNQAQSSHRHSTVQKPNSLHMYTTSSKYLSLKSITSPVSLPRPSALPF
jgi:hypothetical protein